MGAAGVNGKDGTDGQDGRGVSSVTFTEDFCLVFNYSDGTTSQKLGPIKGEKGDKGDKGDAGTDGIGITTVYVDESGNLYITYSNSSISTLLGNVKGPKGDKGDPGSAGQNGVDGKSAFELYQQVHPEYTGTYAEWVDSLKGEKGDPGRGILKTELVNGELIITYTDGTSENLGSLSGSMNMVEKNGLIFELLPDGTYGVRAGTVSSNTEITIPNTVNQRAVTVILDNGFEGCANLLTINMPDSIVDIRDNAFRKCAKLTNITLSKNLDSIGRYAFNKCDSLSKITIPATTEFIGAFAFYQTSLSEAVFEVTNGWTTGSEGFTYWSFAPMNTSGYFVVRRNTWSGLDTPQTAANALSRSVYFSGVYNWYSQDWVRQ